MQRDRKTFILTPAGELIDVGQHVESYLRQRETAKLLASKAKRIGVVVTTKDGYKYEYCQKTMGALLRREMRPEIIACDYFLPEYVQGMPYDAYVFTGCPRVAIDDYSRFDKPVITVAEALDVWDWKE